MTVPLSIADPEPPIRPRDELDARLRQLSAHLPGFLYQYRLRTDGTSHFPYASDGIRWIYGCAPEDVRDDAAAVFAVLHPDDAQRVGRSIEDSARSLEPWHGVYRVRHPQRGEIWVEGNSTPTQHADGSVTWHGYLRDVTEAQAAQRKLRLAASVFTSSQEGIMITDARRRIVDVNPAFTHITGYAREEVLGCTPGFLRSGRHPRSFYRDINRTLAGTGQWRGEVWNRRKNGEPYPEILSIDAVRGDDGDVANYVGVFSDISRLKAHEQELNRIAHYDPLTDLPNRRLLDEWLRMEIARAERKGRSLAVCYLDLDRFKGVNDDHGHAAGDALLKTVATRIKDALRPYDVLARLGGDEFVMLLPDLTVREECVAVVQRVLSVVSRPIPIEQTSVSVSVSVGITMFPADDADGDTLLRHADQAMYAAKQAGGNRLQMFDTTAERRVRDTQALLAQVRHGLVHGEFRLHYQPKVDLRDGAIVGLEALVRWQHATEGLIPPARFLPAILRSRMDRPLGEWVIAEAVRQHLAWRAEGLVLPVSVNVSGHHLLHRDFVPYLQGVLLCNPALDPACLELEILESTALDDLDAIARTLTQAMDLGVKFALDDFGTGYSSLTYLRRLPAQTIKIDQSFVRDMLDDVEDTAIVQGVIGLAASFHREVVAEGVETAAHSTRLAAMGCHVVQGYGIARPLPAEQVAGWVHHWRQQHAPAPVLDNG